MNPTSILRCTALVVSLALAACSSTEDGTPDSGLPPSGNPDAGNPDSGSEPTACAPTLPAAYPFTSSIAFAQNASGEIDLLARFGTIKGLLEGPEKDPLTATTAEALLSVFESGTPSLENVALESHATNVRSWLEAFAGAAPLTWVPSEPPAGLGGRFGGEEPAPGAYYIFTADGKDLRQFYEKASFGSLFYAEAYAIAQSDGLDAASIDRIVALFGAGPGVTPELVQTLPFDRRTASLAAGYTKRRDDPAAATGPFRRAEAAATRAKAILASDEGCQSEARAALGDFFRAWEEAMFATAVFYAGSAKTTLTAATVTPKQQAQALHGLGELTGFVLGFRGLPAEARIATDAQIDEILALVGYDAATGTATIYRFATDTLAEISKLDQVPQRVKAIYGFTDEELTDFATSF